MLPSSPQARTSVVPPDRCSARCGPAGRPESMRAAAMCPAWWLERKRGTPRSVESDAAMPLPTVKTGM